MEKIMCFSENAVFVVEVLVSEHNRQEVNKAKVKGIQNLECHDTFELLEDVGLNSLIVTG